MTTDPWILRIVFIGPFVLALAATIGIVVLTILGDQIPGSLTWSLVAAGQLMSALVGYLFGRKNGAVH